MEYDLDRLIPKDLIVGDLYKIVKCEKLGSSLNKFYPAINNHKGSLDISHNYDCLSFVYLGYEILKASHYSSSIWIKIMLNNRVGYLFHSNGWDSSNNVYYTYKSLK